jgi:transcriptional regulator of met regulon
MTDKLVFNPKKIGKQIINQAIEKHKTQQSNHVISQVSVIMERMQVLTLLQNKTDRQVKLCQDQLDAINSGEFTIGTYTAQIVFNNEDLNINWDDTGRW